MCVRLRASVAERGAASGRRRADAPVDHRPHDGPQVLALGGQRVLEARRMLAVAARLDDALVARRFRRSARMLVGMPSGESSEFREARLAAHQVADDEQRPAIAQHVERARDRAAGTPHRRPPASGGSRERRRPMSRTVTRRASHLQIASHCRYHARMTSVCAWRRALVVGAAALDRSPPLPASAQGAPPPTVRADRVTEPIRLDGRLDERDLRDHARRSPTSSSRSRTRASRPPRRPRRGCSSTTTTSTSRRAARNRIPSGGSPTRCGATRRSCGRTTQFAVLFDTFHDRRNGYIFYANAIGGLADRQITDEGPPNVDWNTVWDVKTGRFDGGWTIEMAIPFKSLRYQPGRDQTWGINLRRVVRWKNEWSYLAQVPRALTTFRGILKVSSAGTLVGLQVPSGGRNLELKPYALAGVSTDRTVTPPLSQRPDRPHRRRSEVRHHAEPDRRPHRQHRLRAGRGRRAAGQPDPLQPVLSREARLLSRGPRHVRVRGPRQRGPRRGRRRHAVPVLQPAHRPRSVARDPAARRRPR